MAISRKLAPYYDDVRAAVEAAGYDVWDASTHMTGSMLVAVKVEVRKRNGKGNDRINTTNVHDSEAMRQAVAENLVRAGHEVKRVRSSWFDWGRGCLGEHAVTFHLVPKAA